MMRKSDAIVIISNYVKNLLFKGDWDNINIISNGVFSVKNLDYKLDKKIKENDSFTFVMMSVVDPSKGIHEAIQAIGLLWNDVKNIRLNIYGDYKNKTYKEQLDNIIRESNLSTLINFMGFVNNPFEIYKNSDAVLVCSRYEAWGRVAAEAMISGVSCNCSK